MIRFTELASGRVMCITDDDWLCCWSQDEGWERLRKATSEERKKIADARDRALVHIDLKEKP